MADDYKGLINEARLKQYDGLIKKAVNSKADAETVDGLKTSKQDKITLPNDATQYYNGTGSWSKPPDTKYGTVSTAGAGLCPTLPGGTSTYLCADGSWKAPPDTKYGTVSNTAPGLCPQLTGNSGQVLLGDGTWGSPPSSSDLEEATDDDITATIALIG